MIVVEDTRYLGGGRALGVSSNQLETWQDSRPSKLARERLIAFQSLLVSTLPVCSLSSVTFVRVPQPTLSSMPRRKFRVSITIVSQ